MGIEQTIQQAHASTDQNISQAFQDLTKLMEKVCFTEKKLSKFYDFYTYRIKALDSLRYGTV